MFNLGQICQKFRSKNLRANLPLPSSTRSLFSDKARCFSQSECALYGNFIINGFGGRCLNIIEVCMDFEPCFKVHNLVSVYPKGMKLGQITNLNVIFHAVVSIYRLVTI